MKIVKKKTRHLVLFFSDLEPDVAGFLSTKKHLNNMARFCAVKSWNSLQKIAMRQ